MNILIIIILAFCIFSSQVNDYLFLIGWLLTLLNLYLLYKTEKRQFNNIDMLVICYCMYDFISIFIGYNPTPAYSHFINTYTIVTFYFICRQLINTTDKARKVVLYVTLFTSAFPLFVIPSFYKTFGKLQMLHFNTFVSDFKFVFTPLGMPANAWSTFLLSILLLHTLYLVLYYNNKKYLLYILPGFISSIFLLINSFARGIYICLAIYFVALLVGLIKTKLKRKQKIIGALGVSVIIAFSCSFYNNDVLKTIKMNETTSQQRSLEGRFHSITISNDIFKLHPWCGVGSGNFGYAENFTGTDKEITLFPGNTASQLMVEKGIIGCIIVLCLLTSLFIALLYYKGLHVRKRNMFIVFLIIIIVREMSYPGILQNSAIQSLFFLLITIMQCYFISGKYTISPKVKMAIFPLSILTCILVSRHLLEEHQNTSYCENYIQAIENKDLFNDELCMKGTNMASNINKTILYWNLYKQQSEEAYLSATKELLQSCIKKAPHDYILQYNLAKVYEAEGDTIGYDTILNSLTHKYPEKVLFKLIASTKKENKESEICHVLIKNPRIIHSDYFNSVVGKENISAKEIKKCIKQQSEKIASVNDPVLYAKYGKLLLWAGDTLHAKTCLEKSIELLPNLIEPRYNLSLIEHHQKNNIMKDLYMDQYLALTKAQLKKEDYKICIDEAYYNNFSSWYGGNTSPNEMIFY